MEVFDRVALLPGEQLIAPHLERFPGLKTLRLAFYQVASATLVVVVSRGGGGGAVNQVKPREQVVGRVATMSLSGLVGASAAGYARHSADAGARCCASGRLGMAAFKQSSVGGVSSTGGVGGGKHLLMSKCFDTRGQRSSCICLFISRKRSRD